jgi:hypothetical protein
MSRVHRLRSLAMFVTAGVYQIGPSASSVQATGKGGAR